jgi:hypothetical protein
MESISQLPVFLANSIPKSGTNLLKQLLLGIPHLSHQEIKHSIYGHLDDEKMMRILAIRPNEFGIGHIPYSADWDRLLREKGIKQLFLTRDPRDVVVSFVPFMKKFPNLSPMTEYIARDLKTDHDRYLALINGVENFKDSGSDYPNIDLFFRQFIGWAHAPNTLHLTFEQLTRNKKLQHRTLSRIIRFLYNNPMRKSQKIQIINKMKQNINPSQSVTFRKGIIGDWKNEFDHKTKNAFKSIAGQLLIDMGYETDFTW